MAFPTDDIFLVDNTPQHNWGLRPATKGVILHTTEGSGPTRADALATARWQNDNPGSYNFIIYDGGVLLTVPYKEACGALNPNNEYFHPERFPWLREMLGAAAYNDPTMYHLQFAFSGKARRLAAGDYPDNMIDTAARLIIWAEDSDWANDNLVLSAHAHWSTNRSDPGAGVLEKVLARIAEIRAPEPTPEPAPTDYKALYEEASNRIVSMRSTIRVLRTNLSKARSERDAALQKIKNATEVLQG